MRDGLSITRVLKKRNRYRKVGFFCCIKALDYVVKSETAFIRLQKIISGIFSYKKMEKELNWYMERM